MCQMAPSRDPKVPDQLQLSCPGWLTQSSLTAVKVPGLPSVVAEKRALPRFGSETYSSRQAVARIAKEENREGLRRVAVAVTAR